jgi:hypothetical protein
MQSQYLPLPGLAISFQGMLEALYADLGQEKPSECETLRHLIMPIKQVFPKEIV